VDWIVIPAFVVIAIEIFVHGPDTLRALRDPTVPKEQMPRWWRLGEGWWRAYRRCGPSASVGLIGGGVVFLIDGLVPSRPWPIPVLEVFALIIALIGLICFLTTAVWGVPKALVPANLRDEPGFND
jgi:hypothetical protein